MTSVHGQASVEYAGLLALAAVLGAALALIAGPPLVGAVRSALAAVLAGQGSHPDPVIASAADIADVQAALVSGEAGLTPDAALLALGRRHRAERAGEVADALLLAAARDTAPWLAHRRTYRAWERIEDGPYEPAEASAAAGADRDVEEPTGAPAVVWITVAAQRRAVAAALAHHASATALALDALAFIPLAGLVRSAARAGAGRITRVTLKRLPGAVDTARTGSGVFDLVDADAGDVPAGMRAGDVVVAWPVRRTFWRNGRQAPEPLVDLGHGLGSHPPARDYLHLIFLRPGAGGLSIIAEGFGA